VYELYLQAGPPTLDETAADVARLADDLAAEMCCSVEDVDELIGAAPRRTRSTGSSAVMSCHPGPGRRGGGGLSRLAGRAPTGAMRPDVAAIVEQVRPAAAAAGQAGRGVHAPAALRLNCTAMQHRAPGP
jgi:hypothetical protein